MPKNQTVSVPTTPAQKKKYTPPQVTRHGTVATVTHHPTAVSG